MAESPSRISSHRISKLLITGLLAVTPSADSGTIRCGRALQNSEPMKNALRIAEVSHRYQQARSLFQGAGGHLSLFFLRFLIPDRIIAFLDVAAVSQCLTE